MRKVLKFFGFLLLFLVAAVALLYLFTNEALPKGEKGPKADALAQKMLQAVNKPAWDSTHVLQWTFKGVHSYLWDKKRNLAQVTWDDNKVLLNPDQISGKAYKGTTELTGDEANKMVKTAWGYWCNDSFWFNAVVKCFDPGTSRSIVKQNDGSDALLVSYDSGGVTPGDSYLWILDENGLPKSYKMWVSIIPIGGLEFTWQDWKTFSTGAKVSTMHESAILSLDMSNVKAATSLEAFGLAEDPFKAIAN